MIGIAGTDVEQFDESTYFYGLLKKYCTHGLNLTNDYAGVFNEDDDLIVGVASQGYGFSDATKEELPGAIHTQNNQILYPAGQPELAYKGSGSSNPGIVSRLITLLNSSVTSSAFYSVPAQ